MLNVRRFGTGPPLVALHGFTLTGEQFVGAADALSRSVVAPDLPGHGGSTDEQTTVDQVVDGVSALLDSTDGRVPLVGYSQGARVALLAALAEPDAISSLVLISATAGIRDAAERARRRESDAELAAGLRTHGLEIFVDDWISRPLTSTAGLPAAVRSEDRALRLTNSPEGLARALEGYGQGAQPDVWGELHQLSIPTLLITGERDEKYSAIARRMAYEIVSADVVCIPDASHNPLVDAPTLTYETISEFLDRHG